MKTLCLTLISFFILTAVHAQKIELSVQANATLFHYSGKSATAETYINTADHPYTNNPYGTKGAAGYGAALQAQYVAKGGFIVGLQAGYDLLRSKVNIYGVTPLFYLYDASGYQLNPAKGESHLTNRLINISPYIGYRLNIKNVKLDLMPGLDLGFNLSAYDKGTATTNGSSGSLKTDYKESNVPTDVRLKFGVAAGYQKFGVTASFAHGVSNYLSKLDGAPSSEAHSELLRFGLSYRIL
jgi:hypothetical protein